MHNIEIDDEVYEYLRKKIRDFAETPNDVLRRLLRLNKKTELKTNKKRVRGATPQESYTMPLLEALIELGGSGSVNDVLYIVERKMKDKLNSIDYGRISSGSIRWANKAMWQRYELVQMGLLKRDSPRGIWEISDAGKEYYYKNKKVE